MKKNKFWEEGENFNEEKIVTDRFTITQFPSNIFRPQLNKSDLVYSSNLVPVHFMLLYSCQKKNKTTEFSFPLKENNRKCFVDETVLAIHLGQRLAANTANTIVYRITAVAIVPFLVSPVFHQFQRNEKWCRSRVSVKRYSSPNRSLLPRYFISFFLFHFYSTTLSN